MDSFKTGFRTKIKTSKDRQTESDEHLKTVITESKTV